MLSSREAKFIALTHATKEALWLQNFITKVIQPLKSPIQLYFLHDIIENGQILIQYLATDQMLADILMKGLQGPKVKNLADKLGIY